jgi:hypothetical protein
LPIRPFSRGHRGPIERDDEPVEYLKREDEGVYIPEQRKNKPVTLLPIKDNQRKNSSQKRLEDANQKESLEGQPIQQAPVIVSGRVFKKAGDKEEQ